MIPGNPGTGIQHLKFNIYHSPLHYHRHPGTIAARISFAG